MRMNTTPPTRCGMLGCLIAISLTASLTVAAAPQSETFRLDDDRSWTQTDAPEPGTDEAVIADARRELAADRPGEAKRILDRWLDENETGESPWLAAALRLRGDALLAKDKEFLALYDYEQVILEFPGSEEFRTAVEREVEIAKAYARGLKIRAFGIRLLSAGDIAIELFIRAHERLPGSDVAEEALIELADFFYRNRQMTLAAESYDMYLVNYPTGPNRVKAQRRRIYADISRYKGPEYDASSLIDARVQIERYMERYPAAAAQDGLDAELIERIDESLAAQMLEAAEWYLGRGDGPSARYTLQRMLAEYPDGPPADRARQILEQRGWSTDVPGTETPAAAPSDSDATDGESEAPE
ncbi:MAG: outer membrane protein assembly factor BamD [Phycisphaerales bacterium]